MTPAARAVQRTYLTLLLCNTLATSLIWGINTIFLLDAGLSNLEAFAANAFFTAGMMLFEIPTGVLADLKGRRISYLWGVVTLGLSTLLYLFMWHLSAPFWAWAGASMLLGLGFTFFSGATEAWLVDAMQGSGYKGRMEAVFARGEIVQGIGMLTGSVAGGIIAQVTDLGVPYILRAVVLMATFAIAFRFMHDIGFVPAAGTQPVRELRNLLKKSVHYGLARPSVRWLLLTSPFAWGVTAYGFYALQPYLLELWGDEKAYGIAGLAAAILAGAQIAGGLLGPKLSHLFRSRTTVLLTTTALTAVVIGLMGVLQSFWAAIIMVVMWGVLFAIMTPVRQAYLNGLVPSQQRATVLSFDALLGSGGGVITQPALGKAADVWGYPFTYVACGLIQAGALPFAWLTSRAARRGQARIADTIFNEKD